MAKFRLALGWPGPSHCIWELLVKYQEHYVILKVGPAWLPIPAPILCFYVCSDGLLNLSESHFSHL